MAGINQCPNCGGNFAAKNGAWVCECCGAPRPELITNEEQFALLTAAKELRASNFDEAEELYLDFISRYPKNHNGYWGLVMSQYGIRYEDDYNGKRIPTCNATGINSFSEDKNFLKAVELAPEHIADFYREQARIIDDNRKEWFEIASREPGYDIFLSYKDTEDDRVTRTKDSYDAQELYTHLRDRGYRVFFSRESLRDKVSRQFEPYIFNALNTAEIMILYGSKPEYFASTWIKNEWQRYYKKILQKLKRRDSLVVAYSKLNPADLPRPLSSMQCMDADRKTFYLDLDRHIDGLLTDRRSFTKGIERVELKTGQTAKRALSASADQLKIRQLGTGGASAAPTLDGDNKAKLALKYIEQDMPDSARKLVDEILLDSPDNAQALWCGLMLSLDIKNRREFTECAALDKLGDMGVLERIINNSSAAEANRFLNTFYSAALSLLPSFNDKAYELTTLLLSYNAEGRGAFIAKITPVISKSADSRFFDLLLGITDPKDLDRHLVLMGGFAESHLRGGSFKIAETYYKRMLELDGGHINAHKGLIAAAIEQKRINVYKTPKLVKLADRLDLIENILVYCDAEEGVGLLANLLNAAIELLREKNADINGLCILYERLLKYLPFEMKLDKYLSYLAGTLVEIGAFKLAERYALLLTSYETERYAAYWLLMRIKLKCRYDANITDCDVAITETEEYENAMASATELGLDGFIDNAIQISKRQKTSLDIRARNKAVQDELDEAARLREEKERKASQKFKRNKRVKSAIKWALLLGLIFTAATLISMYGRQSTEEGLIYRRTGDGYAVVGVKNAMETIDIPDEIDGRPVTHIKKKAFSGDNVITGLYVGKNVTVIEERAFSDCVNLAYVRLDSAARIETEAFDGCINLAQLTFGDKLTSIGDFAFRNCAALSKAEIPAGTEYIGEGAFFKCNKNLVLRCSSADSYGWHADWNAKDYRRIGGIIKTSEYVYYAAEAV